MSLSLARTIAYTFGALTGGFAAVAVLARRRGNRRVTAAAVLSAACCGTLAVAFEERAQSVAG